MFESGMSRTILGAILTLTSVAVLPSSGETLAGTNPLRMEGDIASDLVAGVDRFLLRELEASVAKRAAHWKRDFSSEEAYNKSIEPNRRRLAHILGMREPREKFMGLEFSGSNLINSRIARTDAYEIWIVRWPTYGGMHGEGLYLTPTKREPVAFVVAVPDSDQTPEQLCGLHEGLPEKVQYPRRLAENGCVVIIPTLISREKSPFDWHGRKHGITNREFLYRSAFELGRHLVGCEVQKVLAAVDYCHSQIIAKDEPDQGMGVIGFGDGGMLALYAAALDTRIDSAVVSGYYQNRNTVWKQTIDRNVFSLLEQFGDAEIATMIAPRTLIVEACAHPDFEIKPGTGNNAPAKLKTPELGEVRAEISRARKLLADWPDGEDWLTISGDGTGPFARDDTLKAFFASLSRGAKLAQMRGMPEPAGRWRSETRLERQMREIDRYNQEVLRNSHKVRHQFMSKLDTSSVEAYEKSVEAYRDTFRHEVIGHFDRKPLPPNPRTRVFKKSDEVIQYEVVLDVFPDVIAYGILCLPRDLEENDRRPVVVCQHGLEGRPQSVIGEKDFHYYKAFATELAKRGFVTFAPQNLYIFRDRFRTLQRKAYPLKKTLFSIIVPQHQQIVDWLQTQPFVDPDRIAFYGLSYGGKTAMRVPPLVDDYCLSICSADFNEWVDKNASTHNPRSYVWTGEYEIFEWDLGSTFNYAEMAALIAPRPFMVERGHFDGVADDWTVGWEFAKVRHLYQGKLKIGDRCEIEWFDGPHAINGKGTYKFLHRHLNWPEPTP